MTDKTTKGLVDDPNIARDMRIAEHLERAVVNNRDEEFRACAFANRHLIVAALNSFHPRDHR